VWRAVANRFRDVSGVAGYDLYNEPNSAPLPPHVFEGRWMWPFYAALIETAADVDPNHIFIVEAPLILHPPVVPITPRMLRLDVPNVVYSPHQYTGSIVHPLYPDDPRAVVEQIAEQVLEAEQLSAPAWWGELGVDTGKPFAIDWTDTTLDTLDDLDAGWAWWQWRQDWGWGIRNHRGDAINMEFLRHVARPYLAVAPVGITAGRGDGVGGWLQLRVARQHAALPAIVSWPGLTLGIPHVSGTCVEAHVWHPERAELWLMFAAADGCRVEVTTSAVDTF
jgi:Cellulase (glycosyl hydrolase family 5)